MTTSFAAMGTDVTVLAPGLAPEAAARVTGDIERFFGSVEARFSRFRPGSELSLLNRSTGLVPVSAEMFAALEAARALHAATDGLFDPAVGGALVAHGYDRAWAPGVLDRRHGAGAPAPATCFADVELDARTRSVRRPAGMTIDLGGLLKGRTVDRARALLPRPGALDAGGDAVLVGDGPDGCGWIVEVEDPRDAGRALLSLRVKDAAVATSADNRRTWRLGGGRAHHLIDPRLQRPASSDLAQVTVVARSAELADVVAKVAFLDGARDAERWLARLGAEGAVLVDRQGRARVIGPLVVEAWEPETSERGSGEVWDA